MQSRRRPHKIILWLAEGDKEFLPERVLRLQKHHFEVREVSFDLKQYNKAIHAFLHFPNFKIVTVDDDVWYPPNLYYTLATESDRNPGAVVCWRAHEFIPDESGTPPPYHTWKKWSDVRGPSNLLWFTGKGGVLYPPNSLHADTVRDDLFMQLSPTADDVWFNWMARMAGSPIVRSGRNQKLPSWRQSQVRSLQSVNSAAGATGNDDSIRRMLDYYGFPRQLSN